MGCGCEGLLRRPQELLQELLEEGAWEGVHFFLQKHGIPLEVEELRPPFAELREDPLLVEAWAGPGKLTSGCQLTPPFQRRGRSEGFSASFWRGGTGAYRNKACSFWRHFFSLRVTGKKASAPLGGRYKGSPRAQEHEL